MSDMSATKDERWFVYRVVELLRSKGQVATQYITGSLDGQAVGSKPDLLFVPTVGELDGTTFVLEVMLPTTNPDTRNALMKAMEHGQKVLVANRGFPVRYVLAYGGYLSEGQKEFARSADIEVFTFKEPEDLAAGLLALAYGPSSGIRPMPGDPVFVVVETGAEQGIIVQNPVRLEQPFRVKIDAGVVDVFWPELEIIFRRSVVRGYLRFGKDARSARANDVEVEILLSDIEALRENQGTEAVTLKAVWSGGQRFIRELASEYKALEVEGSAFSVESIELLSDGILQILLAVSTEAKQ